MIILTTPEIVSLHRLLNDAAGVDDVDVINGIRRKLFEAMNALGVAQAIAHFSTPEPA